MYLILDHPETGVTIGKRMEHTEYSLLKSFPQQIETKDPNLALQEVQE
jgi:hypothetical protein